MSYIRNMEITSTHLGLEDHGIFTAVLTLLADSLGTSFGMRNLSRDPECGRYLTNILTVVGVDCWEDVKGRVIRVEFSSEYGQVVRIGHLLKEVWFDGKEITK